MEFHVAYPSWGSEPASAAARELSDSIERPENPQEWMRRFLSSAVARAQPVVRIRPVAG